MMKCKPEYAANIIVGVNYKNRFSWYVIDKDYWILDLIKRRDDFTLYSLMNLKWQKCYHK